MRCLSKLTVVSLALLVSGCGLPPAIVAFTYAMDGLSYASSGKSVSDHALSAAIDQDCSMFRAIQGEEICRDELPAQQDVAIAAIADIPEEAEDGPIEAFGIAVGPDHLSLAAPSTNPTLIASDQSVAMFDSSKGHPDTANLKNFPASTEVYALVQDDGALEIFVYRAAAEGKANVLSHIATYENYSDNPTALKGVSIGGNFHAIGDLIV